MARLHKMISAKTEVRFGRAYGGGEERLWRVEIVDEASMMRIALIELSDAQLGEALGGSPIHNVPAEFIDPAKADRISRVQYQARAHLDVYKGSLRDMPYDKREQVVQDVVSEHLGGATVYAKHTQKGLHVTVYGYITDRAGAGQASRGLLAELETALAGMGWTTTNTEAYVSGE